MAITVVGVAGSMGVSGWVQLGEDLGDAKTGTQVMTGLAVSATTGRTVSVAAGRSLQAGTNLINTAAVTVTLAANASGNPRNDLVVAQVNLAGTNTTAGSIAIVQGAAAASPVDPALTQNISGIWQTPLARVRVANGAATITSSNITDLRPGVIQVVTPEISAVSFAGTWSMAVSPSLQVRRVGQVVEFSGRATRTGGAVAVGESATFGDVAFIPAGFRPTRQVAIMATGDLSSTPDIHQMIINTDGTGALYPLVGNLATNDTIRITSGIWLTEVS